MFVAAMLLILMLASVALTNMYVQYGRGQNQSSDQNGGTQQGQHGNGEKDHMEQGHRGEFYVVTSFYPMYIAAKNVIGDCEGVMLQNLSEPQAGCMHDYQLTTADMRKLSSADAFIVNGGGIESFLADVAGQYPDLTIVNASERIALLDDNAHAWMGITDYMVQVQTIADALATSDAGHAAPYQGNCAKYLEKLEELRQRQQEIVQSCKARNVILFHEAFDYLARDLCLHVSCRMDLDEERQVSAGEVARVLRLIRAHGARVILAEELYGRRMCETVQKEEGDVRVAYLDTCVRGDGDADSYLDAMRENLARIEEAVRDCK